MDRYKEALAKARAGKSLEEIFPEMKESEDERMIKSMTRLVKAFYDCNFPTPEGFERKDLLAWLEKQKEQKPLEESIKEICKPINDVAAYLDEQLQRFKKEPSAEEYANILADEEVQGLSVGGEHIPAIKELIRRAFRFGVKWGKEKEQKPCGCINIESEYDKGWRDGHKAGLKDSEQKPAEWSEEENYKLDSLIRYFKGKDAIRCIELRNYIDRLKSLRPQYHGDVTMTEAYKMGLEAGKASSWKPSEDEERLINTSISFLKDFADKGYENAVECIDWLKSKLNGNSGK